LKHEAIVSNRIVSLKVATHRVEPFEAELWIVVTPERLTPATELRGRFVGPKSAVSSTIEVAYALRPFTRKPPELDGLAARVVIPEPSLWEPTCPFVYDGVVELWQDGQRCDVRQVPSYRLLSGKSTPMMP
jgi:hypothetical protein